ncbi:M36 family metallopeptidase [Dactylosporangium sp. NPDC051541]|uniref:M36 family metallopeptidase n=1 Tax=Dactylosporangium sp. NPDC051541 TaxID=3363977 RepID=UPI00378ADFDD
MGTSKRTAAGLIAVAVIAGLTATAAPAWSAPPPREPVATRGASDFLGEGKGARDVDNRKGTVAPSGQQRSLAGKFGAVRFNAFGTPRALGPAARGRTSLAAGLAADPETAARQFLVQNQALFGIDEQSVAAMDAVLVRPIGSATVVTLRQRFGGLPAGHDGLASILVSNGAVVRVTSSLSRDTREPQPATVSADDAIAAAARDAGLTAAQVGPVKVDTVAVPTPADGPRAAYAVTLSGTDLTRPVAFTTYVDARTGGVLVREDLVDYDADNPSWAVFPAAPTNVVGLDSRVRWCFSPMPACVRTVRDPNSGQAWDVNLSTGQPTFTSSGNAANNVVQWGGGTAPAPATAKPDRNYVYPFTDQWRAARCNPAGFTSAQRNDADAAVTNLFAMHNRMHDWAYTLGFTESAWNMQVVNLSPDGLGGDPEQGRAQSNALGGSRNNANQGTPRDGLPPTSNMFLWQPVAGAAYPPCVDGDYDMTVIGHEYTHAITNRMIAGPDTGIGSFQGGSMGEAWGDLLAGEYLFENGLRAPGDTPFVTGAYVTGNNTTGIRDYDGSKSPLNYSDIGFDIPGPEVHADGEIWVATNLRVRAAFVQRYGAGTPSLQQRCADGQVTVDACPGNRRWAQLTFDSFLLQGDSQVSMTDMRDNMLAADLVRFGGANQDLIWNAFAQSGLGIDATGDPADTDPTPSFASPYANNATVTLQPVGDSAGAVIRLYVGDYEARAVPVADTDPETAIPDTFQIVPGQTFSFTAVGAGYGHKKFTSLFLPGRAQDLKLNLPRNLASTSAGAVLTGDGVNVARLGDDTEVTDWASLDGVAGKKVTVDLAGDRPVSVNTVNVSALLRPAIDGDVDPLGQNRFSALRQFRILACDATASDCSADAGYREVYRSASDAFPSEAFRPTAPQLNLRTFHFNPVKATHLRIQVLTSQCTGNPRYAGEQDNDPAAATDCATASPFAAQVRIAEFQAFSR